MKIPTRGPVPEAISGRALLQRALMVVHFSEVLKLADRDGIAAFQDSIRADYPRLDRDSQGVINLTPEPDGSFKSTTEESSVWRFFDAAMRWRISLTTNALSLEVFADAYGGHEDFRDRFVALLGSIQKHVNPSELFRVGVRFVNSGSVEEGSDVREECAPQLVSVSGSPDLEQALLRWTFSIDEGHLLLTTGLMAKGQTYDPEVYIPNPTARAWILDIDAFHQDKAGAAFSTTAIAERVDALARRAHGIYTWAMPKKK